MMSHPILKSTKKKLSIQLSAIIFISEYLSTSEFHLIKKRNVFTTHFCVIFILHCPGNGINTMVPKSNSSSFLLKALKSKLNRSMAKATFDTIKPIRYAVEKRNY